MNLHHLTKMAGMRVETRMGIWLKERIIMFFFDGKIIMMMIIIISLVVSLVLSWFFKDSLVIQVWFWISLLAAVCCLVESHMAEKNFFGKEKKKK